MKARNAWLTPPGELPSRAQVAVAAFAGIVLGALGGGFLLGAGLFTLILVACGIWRAATYLAAIVDLLEQASPARHETVRIPR